MRTRKVTTQIGGAEVITDYGSDPDHWPHTNDKQTLDGELGDIAGYGTEMGTVLKTRQHDEYTIRLVSGGMWESPSHPEIGRFTSEQDFLIWLEKKRKEDEKNVAR